MNWRAFLERLRAAVFPDPEAAAVLDAAERVETGMSRRSFLRAGLLAATVAATVDVEQLLWTPGEKTLFLPSVEEVAVDWLPTPDWVTCEALRILKKNLQLSQSFSRTFDESHRIGDTVTVRIQRRFKPYAEQNVSQTVNFTLAHQLTSEIQLPRHGDNPTRYLAEHVEPHMKQMAHELSRRKVDVFAPLPLPGAVSSAVNVSDESGVVVRGVSIFDPQEARMRFRVDVLGGSSTRRRLRA